MIFLAAAVAFQLGASSPAAGPTDVHAVVARARAARVQQDSMLASYETVVRQRLSSSVGIGTAIALATKIPLGVTGGPRLAARYESVVRVGWAPETGAWGEVLAARSVVPMVGATKPMAEWGDVGLVLPYYPGRDVLWPTSELKRAFPQTTDWIAHPLSEGADSVYVFSFGDSLNIRLPDEQLIHLREIRVRPRRPDARLIVGSLWVDVATGHLVRAAYRPSAPVDLWPLMERELYRNDRNAVEKFGPFTGIIREIITDYGLYQGRFWLPRTRVANAEGTATGGRITLSIEQAFEYSNVRAVPEHAVRVPPRDSTADVDPRTGRRRRPKIYAVEDRGTHCRQRGDTTRWSPDSTARDTTLAIMVAEGVPFRVVLPCVKDDLATSPLLPASIYSPGEELFPNTDFDALRKEAAEALSLDKQSQWSPRPWLFHYGIDRELLRFNRIEGASAGLMAERDLGAGYTVSALARLGSADRVPLAEVSLRRNNVTTNVQASAYRRLAAANDWGNPLGPGASLSAFLFGRDDGFYFRTLGAEVGGARRSAGDAFILAWRLFGERQTIAFVTTQGSLAHAVNGTQFRGNLVASEGQFFGGATTAAYAWGLDPRGVRLTGNTRLESATGKSSYGRAMTELSVATGLSDNAQLIVTGAAGSGIGTLPAQRWWYLGGPYTVHGQPSGAVAGDAFWLGRAELTKGSPLVRPIVFADMGWAGARNAWVHSPNPIGGAGIGAAMLQNLIRLDVSRGFQPTRPWRVDLYLEIR